MIRQPSTVSLMAAVCLIFAFWSAGPVGAQDDPTFELHDWSVWLADPTLEHVNAKDHFFSAMPGVVDSTRFRQSNRGPKQPQPLGMMTFYGDAVDDVEIDFRINNGRFMSHWPASRAKSSRLQWIETALLDKLEDSTQLAYVGAEHWFQQARQGDGLYVRRGARTERFIAYDAELKYTVPVKLSGGPDKYRVRNLAATELRDLVLCLPTPEGRRIGWLDTLPAGSATEKPAASEEKDDTPPGSEPPTQPAPAAAFGVDLQPAAAPAFQGIVDESTAEDTTAVAPAVAKPAEAPADPAPASTDAGVEIVMSDPLAADDPQLLELTRAALAERLLSTGLNQPEIDLILARYGEAMFESDKMAVVFRYGDAAVEERLPLVTYPDPIRTVRVALVVVRNIDPQIGADIRDLVVQLGNTKYGKRESAHKRLAELGRLAIPALKDALKNTDPEIVIRAERLLLAQNESIDTK